MSDDDFGGSGPEDEEESLPPEEEEAGEEGEEGFDLDEVLGEEEEDGEEAEERARAPPLRRLGEARGAGLVFMPSEEEVMAPAVGEAFAAVLAARRAKNFAAAWAAVGPARELVDRALVALREAQTVRADARAACVMRYASGLEAEAEGLGAGLAGGCVTAHVLRRSGGDLVPERVRLRCSRPVAEAIVRVTRFADVAGDELAGWDSVYGRGLGPAELQRALWDGVRALYGENDARGAARTHGRR